MVLTGLHGVCKKCGKGFFKTAPSELVARKELAQAGWRYTVIDRSREEWLCAVCISQEKPARQKTTRKVLNESERVERQRKKSGAFVSRRSEENASRFRFIRNRRG